MNIASVIELAGRDDPKVDILHLVRNWLCDERNGRWLLILDNADDDSVFSSTTPNRIASRVELILHRRPWTPFFRSLQTDGYWPLHETDLQHKTSSRAPT